MINLRLTQNSDIKEMISWNTEKEEFLKQWSNYKYPLTEYQIMERIESDDYVVFSVDLDNEIVGTIQLFKINYINKSARVGCFLINPKHQGKGIGTKSLTLVIKYAFENMDMEYLELGVFDFNLSAIKCYEKCNFKKISEYLHPMGWKGYNMSLINSDMKADS